MIRSGFCEVLIRNNQAGFGNQEFKTFLNRHSFGHDSLITLGNEESEFGRLLNVSSHFRLKDVCKHSTQVISEIVLILQYRY